MQQTTMTEPMNAIGLWLLLPLGLWIVWWLLGVNWQKLWPVLARGGWAPAVLLFVMGAVVWSRLQPWRFVWQLGVAAALAVLALFCGWLQPRIRATPAEISLEPPAAADEGHGHAH